MSDTRNDQKKFYCRPPYVTAKLGRIKPMLDKLANAQYNFMQNKAAAINSNLKTFWIAMGGKEDIAYNNCRVMMQKLDDPGIKYKYYEYPRRVHLDCVEKRPV